MLAEAAYLFLLPGYKTTNQNKYGQSVTYSSLNRAGISTGKTSLFQFHFQI